MNKKFYITTPIFYANGDLHLGHAYALVLADIIARYQRSIGKEVFFLTGSDEHGDKIIRAAQSNGVGPQLFVDNKAANMRGLISQLNISNDGFIRTSDQKEHWLGAEKLWRALEETGDIYKGTYKGLYCTGCEAFITEKDLVNEKCVYHDAIPETIEEENYFFKLSKYKTELKDLLETGGIKITPQSKVREMVALLDTVDDISISRPARETKWGIPIPTSTPHTRHSTLFQLMYVWCDALSSYLSALGYGGNDEKNFNKFWPADLHVLGKEILRFHVLILPAFLLSAKLPLPRQLLVHGFINSGGKKMSKSIGNVLYPDDFILEYGVDALRCYFAREAPPTEDWDLTHEKFKQVYNANLAHGLGNLVSRVLKMAEQYFGGQVLGNEQLIINSEQSGGQKKNIFDLIKDDISPRYHLHMNAYEINKATDVIWELIGNLDKFITDHEPFTLIKTDKEATQKILWSLLFGLREIAGMLVPIMPVTAEKILNFIQVTDTIPNKDVIFSTKVLKEPLFKLKE